jgi:hypothetical protein
MLLGGNTVLRTIFHQCAATASYHSNLSITTDGPMRGLLN